LSGSESPNCDISDGAKHDETAALRVDGTVALAIVAPILIAFTVFGVYARLCHADFIGLDDNINIFANPYFSDGGHLGAFWREPYQGLYIPVAYTLMGLLAPFGRIGFPNPALTDTGALYNPHFFHVVNLTLHVANVLLVYTLLRLLVKRVDASAAGALVFAFHPLQVESVAWISEFRGLFAALFTLTGLVAYVSATRTSGAARTAWYAVWGVAAGLAILCKPSAVCVPLLAFIIDTILLRRSWRTALLGTIPLLIVFIPFIVYMQALQPVIGGNYGSVWTRPLVASDALAFYIAKFVAPFNLLLDYGRQPKRVLESGVACWSWLLPFALAVGGWNLRRRVSWLPAATLISLAALLPVAGLVPFRFQVLSTVADRYMYLAMLGPAIAVAFLWLAARPADVRAAVVVVLLAWVGLTIHQVRYWDNSVTIFSQSLRTNPNSALLECHLANSYQSHGQIALALTHYDRAIALDPEFFKPQIDRADLELAMGKLDDALHAYRKINAHWQKSRMAPLGIGQVYEHEGKLDDALNAYAKLVTVVPEFEPARVHLGVMLMDKRQYAQALTQFESAIKYNSDDGEAWIGVGNIASLTGNSPRALVAYSRAAALDPGSFDAEYDFGVLLLSVRRIPEAVVALRRASSVRPLDADAHDTLGVVLFDNGDRAGAIREFQAALKIDPRHPSALRHISAMFTP